MLTGYAMRCARLSTFFTTSSACIGSSAARGSDNLNYSGISLTDGPLYPSGSFYLFLFLGGYQSYSWYPRSSIFQAYDPAILASIRSVPSPERKEFLSPDGDIADSHPADILLPLRE